MVQQELICSLASGMESRKEIISLSERGKVMREKTPGTVRAGFD